MVMKRFKKAAFRWQHIVIMALYVVPFVLLSLLGVVWLFQHGLLLHFFIFCLIASILAYLTRKLATPAQSKKTSSSFSKQDIEVDPNPEWSKKEKDAFYQTCVFVHEATETVQPWRALPNLALEVIQKVTINMGGNQKKALDFSAPEALLLIEQTASRYRNHLRSKMPFADQISIATVYWFWQKRKHLSYAWKFADGGRRLARFASNPTGAMIMELEQLITGGTTNHISDQMMSTLQTLFLEEVASVAIDLYSGRLKFSDAELLNIELETTKQDKNRIAQPDEPLRIMLVGQVSSGKSSLLNNLLDDDAAETDAAATTSHVVNYQTEIEGTPCHLLDSPGLDGTEENLDLLVEEISNSDLIVWTIRIDRPSRAADHALMQRLKDWENVHPLRRQPVIVFAGTFIDRLSNTWPFPENKVSDDTQASFLRATQFVENDLDIQQIIPVSNTAPAWNIKTLASQIEFQIAEALMVQRNRRRLAAHKKSSSTVRRAKTGLSSFYRGAKTLSARWYKQSH